MTAKVYRVASGENGENTIGIYGPVRALAYGLLMPKVSALLQDLSLDVEKMLNVGQLEDRLRGIFQTEGQREFLPEFGVFVEYLPVLTNTAFGVRPSESPGRKSSKGKVKQKGKPGRPRKNLPADGNGSDNESETTEISEFSNAEPLDSESSDLDDEDEANTQL
jgi:hypothetical protein